MQRPFAYVDGFNLYSGMLASQWRRHYLLNLVALIRALIRSNQKHDVATALCIGLLFLTGCNPTGQSPTTGTTTEQVKTPAAQYAALAKHAKGIAIGPSVSNYTVFVMFDPHCLHCARLWEESKALTETIKFVWVPVNFFDGNSKPKSALLLSSVNPLEDMTLVMSSVLARQEPLAVQEAVPTYLEAVIKSNTDLINQFHVLVVPYVVARNQTTSEYVARQGGMSKEMLKRFLGVGSR